MQKVECSSPISFVCFAAIPKAQASNDEFGAVVADPLGYFKWAWSAAFAVSLPAFHDKERFLSVIVPFAAANQASDIRGEWADQKVGDIGGSHAHKIQSRDDTLISGAVAPVIARAKNEWAINPQP